MAGQASTTIVVGLDFSDDGTRALDSALRFASLFPGVDVHVLHVDDSAKHFESSFDTTFDQVEHTVQTRVKALAPSLGGLRNVRILTHVRGGSPATEIVQLAADMDADLVVVGTKGRRGLERLVMGSVAESVARHARCPVWVVRPKDHQNVGEVPNIEPPCAQCMAKRRETNGEQLWCATHMEKHIVPHRLTYVYEGSEDDTSAYHSTPG